MRNLLTVSLLGVLLSIPSVVFAQASWYGSIRTGIESDDSNNTGVADFASRWGIQGSSEVSEGLTGRYTATSEVSTPPMPVSRTDGFPMSVFPVVSAPSRSARSGAPPTTILAGSSTRRSTTDQRERQD